MLGSLLFYNFITLPLYQSFPAQFCQKESSSIVKLLLFFNVNTKVILSIKRMQKNSHSRLSILTFNCNMQINIKPYKRCIIDLLNTKPSPSTHGPIWGLTTVDNERALLLTTSLALSHTGLPLKLVRTCQGPLEKRRWTGWSLITHPKSALQYM